MRKISVNKADGKRKEILIPQSFKIKIIDFGGATFDEEHKSTIVNTRQYRGPEVSYRRKIGILLLTILIYSFL